LPDDGTVDVTWWNMRGERIGQQSIQEQKGFGEVRIEDLSTGVYQVRFIYISAEGKREEWEGRIVSVGK
jgi:hypothetical protein